MMNACLLEIPTFTESSPIWPEGVNALDAARRTHSGYGKSWAVDLGSGSLPIYLSTVEVATSLCVCVSTCGSRCFHDVSTSTGII